MPTLHWAHVVSGAASGIAFLALALNSKHRGTGRKLLYATAAGVVVLMLWTGYTLSRRFTDETLMTSYVLHVIVLPLILSVGVMVIAIVKLIRWLTTTRGNPETSSV
jgi:hypothetical protein